MIFWTQLLYLNYLEGALNIKFKLNGQRNYQQEIAAFEIFVKHKRHDDEKIIQLKKHFILCVSNFKEIFGTNKINVQLYSLKLKRLIFFKKSNSTISPLLLF